MKKYSSEILEARENAMIAMVSSAVDRRENRKTIAKYLKILRKEKEKELLFFDMATIRHQGGYLKTSYRKIMKRAHPNNWD
jgi:hypothetical protein